MRQELSRLIEKERKSAEESERRRIEHTRAFESGKSRLHYELLPKLRKARPCDYKRWLKGFLDEGGNPTHYYDYPMDRQHWYAATKNIVIFPLFGSSAISVIIPEGIQVDISQGRGHNEIYLMDRYTKPGESVGFVPVFCDTII